MDHPVVSFVNLKGGVGKTAIAVNFAAYCGLQGVRTLLVDLDPQTNATFWCLSFEDWEKAAAEKGTVADLLGVRKHTSAEGAERDAKSVIHKTGFKNVELIPSHIDLFSVDLDLGSAIGRELRLRKALSGVAKNYDLIVCDCPPNLTIPTQNALAFSSHYVVPVSPDYLSAIGIGLLLNRVKEFCDVLDLSLEHLGIVLSRVGRPAQHRERMMTSIEQQFKKLVLSQQIKERAAVSEAAEKHKSIYDSGDQQAIAEFEALNRPGKSGDSGV